MKKTVTVNLNGRVFTMDEDAYQLLDIYLHNLRLHFKKEEGVSEILADFEGRIEELFTEKLRTGCMVITLAQVEEVIARMGKPADFVDADEVNDEKPFSAPEPKVIRKKIFRNMQDKVIAGVCSGIAAYFGWDTVWVRVAFIVLFLLGGSFFPLFADLSPIGFPFGSPFGHTLLLIYLVAWIVIPKARTAEEKLQMRGEPITVENIGRMVAAQATPPPETNNGCLNVFAVLVKIALIGLACLIVLPLLFAFGIMIIVLFAVLFGIGGEFTGGFFEVADTAFSVHHPLLASITFILLTGIPLVALIYWGIARIAKLKPASKTVNRVALAVWLIALILFFFYGIKINKSHIFTPFQGWNISESGINLHHKDKGIRGNDVFSEKEYVISEPVEVIRTGNRLSAKLIIEQTTSDSTTLRLSGDENLIANVNYEWKNKQLLLSAGHSIKQRNNLVIRIQTPALKKFTMHSVGSASFPESFTAEVFVIELKGVGSVTVNDLSARSLEVDADGVGSVDIAGKVERVRLETDGVGKIDALQLVADTVYAQLDGVGYIRCNPLRYLKARSGGVGKISYREEPVEKDVHASGISKIGKD
ncbi:MAG: DUF2807 domain-containing protein [Tannerella sp.]|jgi:phage shock protein PspC (stress-responsive transcriptional regulator)|nr:DUF2807 domain-containing protein [Tannerella sp.]